MFVTYYAVCECQGVGTVVRCDTESELSQWNVAPPHIVKIEQGFILFQFKFMTVIHRDKGRVCQIGTTWGGG